MTERKTADWSIPDEHGNIQVPGELLSLFNKVATQVRFHTISGKNEVITVAHIVQHAAEYAEQVASLRSKQLQEEKTRLREALERIVSHEVKSYSGTVIENMKRLAEQALNPHSNG